MQSYMNAGCDISNRNVWEYYISNDRRMPIHSGEHLQFDNNDGVEELIPYLKHTSTSLTSRFFQSLLLLCDEVCQKNVRVVWCCFPSKLLVVCCFSCFVSNTEQAEVEPSSGGLQVIKSQVDLKWSELDVYMLQPSLGLGNVTHD